MGEVLVDAIDPKGEFINFLDSQVGVVAPKMVRLVLVLLKTNTSVFFFILILLYYVVTSILNLEDERFI